MRTAIAAPPQVRPSLSDGSNNDYLGLAWVGVTEDQTKLTFFKAECKKPARNLVQIIGGGPILGPFLGRVQFIPKEKEVNISIYTMEEEETKHLPYRTNYEAALIASTALNSEGHTYVPVDHIRKYQENPLEKGKGIGNAIKIWMDLFQHYERKRDFFERLLVDLGTKERVEIQRIHETTKK